MRDPDVEWEAGYEAGYSDALDQVMKALGAKIPQKGFTLVDVVQAVDLKRGYEDGKA